MIVGVDFRSHRFASGLPPGWLQAAAGAGPLPSGPEGPRRTPNEGPGAGRFLVSEAQEGRKILQAPNIGGHCNWFCRMATLPSRFHVPSVTQAKLLGAEAVSSS